MEIEQVVAELYAAPPDEFVARRDAATRAARADGDRALATAIAGLRKPTVGAWLANLLSHEEHDQVVALAELGAALREAQAVLDPDELRALAPQRNRVVSGLLGLAGRLAAERGHRVGDGPIRELESTLTAALADPAAAEQLLDGRLTTALSYSGFGEAGSRATAHRGGAPRAKPKPVSLVVAPVDDPAAAEHQALVDAAERDLAQARLQAAAASAAATAADAARADAAGRLEEATRRVDEARAALAEAEAGVTATTDDLARRTTESSAALEAAEAAERAADQAAQALEALVADR